MHVRACPVENSSACFSAVDSRAATPTLWPGLGRG
jgi:hypothetical protein